jgi:hypothetical protein
MEAIRSGDWPTFDDACIVSNIHKLRDLEGTDSVVVTLCDAVLKRTPPKLLAEIESIEPFGQGPGEAVLRTYREYTAQISEKVSKWSKESAIDRRLWYVRGPITKPITKVGPVGVWGQPEDREQAIHILRSADSAPVPLVDYPPSLMSVLSRYALYSIRIYAAFPYGSSDTQVNILKQQIVDDLPQLPWK